MQLINKAVSSNIAIEQLRELMQLKREYDMQQAEEEFNIKFCAFQSEIPPIKKNHSVYDKSGQLAYKYASLDDILVQIKPLFEKFKFTYQWDEIKSDLPNHKKIVCRIFGSGCSRSASIDLPEATGTRMNNAVQLEGSRNSYGRRYSFCNLTGITPEDDDDGRSCTDIQPQKSENIKQQNNMINAEINRLRNNIRQCYKEISAQGYENEEWKNFIAKLNTKTLNALRIGLSRLSLLHKEMGLDKINQEINNKEKTA